ncbi:MAG: hypothetical protein HGA59_00930 [Chlorobiaceae bacterium]|nr:hypothetical protein [Chlorobiaceae bacterium]
MNYNRSLSRNNSPRSTKHFFNRYFRYNPLLQLFQAKLRLINPQSLDLSYRQIIEALNYPHSKDISPASGSRL